MDALAKSTFKMGEMVNLSGEGNKVFEISARNNDGDLWLVERGNNLNNFWVSPNQITKIKQTAEAAE
jgi:hypothetical protein